MCQSHPQLHPHEPLSEEDREALEEGRRARESGDVVTDNELGRAAPSALRVYDLLRQRILVSSTRAVDELGPTWPTVQAALERLEKMEIVRKASGKKRNRLYEYASQLHILDQGIDSPQDHRPGDELA